uniref:NADH dehydrogenase subunit 4L n=1 Tax=Amblyomma boeroi TaxID=575970 RepID=UPI002E7634E9|nr:NADH dehydrogenase subunit 4L [Amblyomma boeroi]WQF68988.1 NADH dehydrogenase subunit 4L [Amblyomma boeroi]
MMMILVYLYCMGVTSMILNRFHLIMILMSIEFLYMSLLLAVMFIFCKMNILNSMLFLMAIVCEAAVGLSLLVLLNFHYGNELLNSMNLIKC